MKQTFIKDQAYKVLLDSAKRKKTLYFNGIVDVWGEDSDGKIVITGQAYKFSSLPEGCGNNLWLTDDHIVSTEEVKAVATKSKEPKQCNRCYGAGRFEHLKHIDNGICYKCGGTGHI